jgi:hypothetical protein
MITAKDVLQKALSLFDEGDRWVKGTLSVKPNQVYSDSYAPGKPYPNGAFCSLGGIEEATTCLGVKGKERTKLQKEANRLLAEAIIKHDKKSKAVFGKDAAKLDAEGVIIDFNDDDSRRFKSVKTKFEKAIELAD